MAIVDPIQVSLADGTPLSLRVPATDDAERLRDLVHELWEDGEGQIVAAGERSLTVEAEREWIERHRRGPHHYLLVAEHEERLVGVLDFHPRPYTRCAHVGEVAIGLAAAFRGRGLGTAMMRRFLGWARSRSGVEKVVLRVRGDNERALALYEHLGFAIDGRGAGEVRLEDGQYIDQITMNCWVR